MIQSFNDAAPKNEVELIQVVRAVFVNYPKNKINCNWLTLQCCFNHIIKNHGGNEYKIDHIKEKVGMQWRASRCDGGGGGGTTTRKHKQNHKQRDRRHRKYINLTEYPSYPRKVGGWGLWPLIIP